MDQCHTRQAKENSLIELSAKYEKTISTNVEEIVKKTK